MHLYEGGRKDWSANGLPIEGKLARELRLAQVARTGVPTCGLRERVGEVRERARDAGWDTAVVVDDRNVVLGRVRRRVLEGDPDAIVEEVMDPGPSTYRLDVPAGRLAHDLAEKKVRRVLVTTSDGELVGVFDREDVLAREPDRTRGRALGGGSMTRSSASDRTSPRTDRR